MSAEEAEVVRHYNRAPIVRAALDFLIEPVVESVGAELIHRFLAELGDAYPSTPELSELPEDAPPLRALRNVRASTDKLDLIEPREDGFAFSRLAPYESWELFSAEARRTWDIYSRIFGTPALRGFEVRYMNMLRIPYGIPLHRFLSIYPHTPQRDVLFNKVFMFYEIDTKAPPGKLQVLLFPGDRRPDNSETFQMFLSNQFSFAVTNPDSLWESFPAIRKLKNDMFNSQITDEFKETIA